MFHVKRAMTESTRGRPRPSSVLSTERADERPIDVPRGTPRISVPTSSSNGRWSVVPSYLPRENFPRRRGTVYLTTPGPESPAPRPPARPSRRSTSHLAPIPTARDPSGPVPCRRWTCDHGGGKRPISRPPDPVRSAPITEVASVARHETADRSSRRWTGAASVPVPIMPLHPWLSVQRRRHDGDERSTTSVAVARWRTSARPHVSRDDVASSTAASDGAPRIPSARLARPAYDSACPVAPSERCHRSSPVEASAPSVPLPGRGP